MYSAAAALSAVLESHEAGRFDRLRVMDVGCGSTGLVSLCGISNQEHLPAEIEYIGIDRSEAMTILGAKISESFVPGYLEGSKSVSSSFHTTLAREQFSDDSGCSSFSVETLPMSAALRGREAREEALLNNGGQIESSRPSV